MEQGNSIKARVSEDGELKNNEFLQPLRDYLGRRPNYASTKNDRSNPKYLTSSFGYGDNEHHFIENLKLYPELLTTYIDRPVEYRVNSHGCRSDKPFTPDIGREVDIYLGDSFTFGVGHYEENIWPRWVGKWQGRDIINLGIPGGGIEASFHLLSTVINHYIVRNVFHYQPIAYRYSFPYETDVDGKNYKAVDTLIPSALDDPLYMKNFKDSIPWNDVGMYNLTDQEYAWYNHFTFVNAIKGLCASTITAKDGFPNYYHLVGVMHRDEDKLIFKDGPFTQGKKQEIESFDFGNNLVARDIAHGTSKMNIQIANTFKKLKNFHPEGYTGFENYGEVKMNNL